SSKPSEPERDAAAETNKIDLLIGQSQSLLIVGTQTRDLEKILARQNGAAASSLGEQPVFQANYNALFRDATTFAWLDLQRMYDQLMKSSEPAAPGVEGGIGNLRAQKVLPALGLGELKSIAMKFAMRPEGYEGQLFLTVPEASRQGLLKILAPPA